VSDSCVHASDGRMTRVPRTSNARDVRVTYAVKIGLNATVTLHGVSAPHCSIQALRSFIVCMGLTFRNQLIDCYSSRAHNSQTFETVIVACAHQLTVQILTECSLHFDTRQRRGNRHASRFHLEVLYEQTAGVSRVRHLSVNKVP
jgi:hypothetical protein